MANPFFKFKEFIIYQDQSAFKVTTDACILGSYAEYVNPKRICDIGTGTGILALMMAQKFSTALIDAVEIDVRSAEQALRNVRSSPWKNRIKVHVDGIQNFSAAAETRYDLVICNPPYFKDHLRSLDYRKNLSRHDISLTLSELASSVDRLLAEDGCFYTILPPVSFNTLHVALHLPGIYLTERLDIFIKPDKPLYRIIGGFRRKQGNKEHHHLYIYDQQGNYTDSFKSYLKSFYLAF